MAAGKYNIQAEKNEALVILMTYKDDADQPLDLTDTVVYLTLKSNTADPLGVVTTEASFNPMTLLITDALNGEFKIDLNKTIINSIPFSQGIYYIDLEGSAPTSLNTRLVEGKFQIVANSSY